MTSKAPVNILVGTSGSDHLNGGALDDELYGFAGNDFLNGGSGNDSLDGGAGSDTVAGDSGDDLLIYKPSENVGSRDVYDGGSGFDALRLDLTNAELQSAAVRTDITNYL